MPYSTTRTVVTRDRVVRSSASTSSERNDPSSRRSSIGSAALARARQHRSAPLAANAENNLYEPPNPRSANTSIPGSQASINARAIVFSPIVYAPISAPKTAWVPHSANATIRSLGNAAPSPRAEPGRPNAASLSAVSGTSTPVPSIDTSRRPNMNAPGVASDANGTQPRSNNNLNGSGPIRVRAWVIAGWDGTVHDVFQPDSHDKPSTRLRITSSYPDRENNANPIT